MSKHKPPIPPKGTGRTKKPMKIRSDVRAPKTRVHTDLKKERSKKRCRTVPAKQAENWVETPRAKELLEKLQERSLLIASMSRKKSMCP
jgi:hypothetical protein